MSETEVASVLPKELRLGVPPKMPQARSYLFRQQSTITSYTPGMTIQINIPRLQRSYLSKDSYLRFTLTGSYTAAATLAGQTLAFDTCGAWGLFEKMEVFDYLGSTVLESISGVPQLMSLLLDLGLEGVLDKNIGNCSYGLARDYIPNKSLYATKTDSTARTAITSFTTSFNEEVLPPSSGVVLDRPAAGASQKFCFEFSIPLPSFLGFLSNKMIPLHNGFTIVLTLASVNKPFIYGQDPSVVSNIGVTVAGTPALSSTAAPAVTAVSPSNFTWSVQNVNMQCHILELGPIAESMIMSSTQGQPLIVHTKAMRYYTGTVKGGNWASGSATESYGAADFTLNLNLNVASLTNILWFMRSGTYENSLSYNTCGYRTRNLLHRWWFQYGSTSLPQSNGIETMALSLPSGYTVTTRNDTFNALSSLCTEGYSELMKARPVYLNASRICNTNYAVDSKLGAICDQQSTATNSIRILNLSGIYATPHQPYHIGRFAAGLNLELAPNKYGSIISGLNTNGMNTSIRGQFHPTYLSCMDSVTVDAYAEYDAFINISPGIATTVSF